MSLELKEKGLKKKSVVASGNRSNIYKYGIATIH